MSSQRPVISPEEVWRRYDDMEVRLTAPLSHRMLELARLGPGDRVLDLATGRGEPAISAAVRVGPSGAVLGIDLSASMLAMARARADRAGLQNLDLRVGNACALEGVPSSSFDVVFVRWGLQYMDAPQSALAGAQRALVPGGRLVAAVWCEPERVSYFSFPRRVLERYRSLPEVEPSGPGSCYYGDAKRLQLDVEQAGLRVEHAEELWLPVMEAASDAELVAWVRAFGLTRLLDELPEATQQAWEADLIRQAEPYRQHGVVRRGGVTCHVVATRAEPL